MMQTKDEKVNLNKHLLEKAMEKAKAEFAQEKIKLVDFIMMMILLALYKKKKMREEYVMSALDHPSQLSDDNYIAKTIAIHKRLLKEMKHYKNYSFSQIINFAMAIYIVTPLAEYTDCIAPLYTIVGSKNQKMQKETAAAVEKMHLNHCEMTLIDACCATGSLFFGLHTYKWKKVILNDLNPLRTNFLNVLKEKPLSLIRLILDADLSFIKNRDRKKEILDEYKECINRYEEKRRNYHKVDCDPTIAYKMFIVQCINKRHIESKKDIIKRMLRFLPAHLKLITANAIITQEDCKKYLENNCELKTPGNVFTLDNHRLLLLDPPYIGSEKQCGVSGYDYEKFHKYTAECLKKAEYKFLYYCRSSAPKSKKILLPEEAEHAMKVNLGKYFFNKGFHFHNKELTNRTNDNTKKVNEVMISNMLYDPNSQFQWTDFHKDIFNSQSSDN